MFDGSSTYADSVDIAMMWITGTSVFLLLGITVAMIYFVFRYNRKRNPKATQIHGNLALEIIWIVIPTIIVLGMFWVGFEGFQRLRATADIANVVEVEAYMWGWDFIYENGYTSDTLYIPVDVTTKLELTSRDVIHSLYIPAFRMKEDVVAGTTHYMILTPNKVGKHDIACAEYCGRDHSQMYTAIIVLSQEDYNEWLINTTVKEEEAESENEGASGGESQKNDSPEGSDSLKTKDDVQALNLNPEIYRERLENHPYIEMLKKNSCMICHSLDGSRKIGPSFRDMASGYTIVIEDGVEKKVAIDREYIKNSIIEPNKQLVKGFKPNLMPMIEGRYTDDDLEKFADLFLLKKIEKEH